MSAQELTDFIVAILNTAVVGVIIGATISWLTARHASSAQKQQWVNDRRVQAYSTFLTAVAELRDLERKPTFEEAHKLLVGLSAVQMFGSLEVIKKARQLKSDTGEALFPDESPYASPRQYLFLREDELVNEIRRELDLEPFPLPDERRNRWTQLKPGRSLEDSDGAK